METEMIRNEIVGLERKYWQALIDKDVEAALSMTHFPCIVTGPEGAHTISEDQYREMLKASDTDKYDGIDIRDAKVEVVNEEMAILTYLTQMNGVDMLDVSTWVHESNKWVCAFHSENPIKSSGTF